MVTFEHLVHVYSEKKLIGTIKKTKGGWAYFPKIGKRKKPIHWAVFKRRSECLRAVSWPQRPTPLY